MSWSLSMSGHVAGEPEVAREVEAKLITKVRKLYQELASDLGYGLVSGYLGTQHSGSPDLKLEEASEG